MNEGRRARRKAMGYVLGVLGAILLSLGGVFLHAWVSAGRVIEHEGRSIAAEVEVFRAERVRIPNLFEPVEEGNAWEPYVAALKELETFDNFDLDVFPALAGDEVPRIDDEAIALMAVRLKPVFDLLRRACHRREVEPREDYEELMRSPAPYYGCIKLNRIIRDLVAHEHRMGDEEAALELAAMGTWTGFLHTAKGFLTDELIRETVIEMKWDALRKILSDHFGSAEVFRSFGTSMDRLDSALPEMAAIIRRDDLALRQAVLAGLLQKNELPSIGSWWNEKKAIGFRRRLPVRVRAAQWFRWKGHVASGLPGIERSEPWNRIEAANRVMKSAGEEPIEAVGEMLPLFYQRRLEERRQWTLLRLALALAAYSLERGTYPDRLEDLAPDFVPTVSPDPLNGKAISYLKEQDHAVVYAFGDDGDDDGGRPVPDDYSTTDGDLVWTVKRRGAEVK